MILHTGNSKELFEIAAKVWPTVFPETKFTDCYTLSKFRVKVHKGIQIGEHFFKSGGITLTADGLIGSMTERPRSR